MHIPLSALKLNLPIIIALGDVSDKCMSMGPHFNPENFDHGAPQDQLRHAGDLGNIDVNGEGRAFVNITDTVLGVKSLQSIIGRGLVVSDRVAN